MDFDVSYYRFSHGKAPRGSGRWAFEIGGHVYFYDGSYSAAKEYAATYAAFHDVFRVKVLP